MQLEWLRFSHQSYSLSDPLEMNFKNLTIVLFLFWAGQLSAQTRSSLAPVMYKYLNKELYYNMQNRNFNLKSI